MKILIDLVYVRPDNIYSSLSVYAFRILDTCRQMEHSHEIVLLVTPEVKKICEERFPEFECIIYSVPVNFWSKIKYVRILYALNYYRRVVNHSDCDSILITGDVCMYTVFSFKINKIFVIHDLKSLTYGETTKLQKIISKFYYKQQIKSSVRVIAISEYVKQTVLNIYKSVKPEKIKTIYNSVIMSEEEQKPSGIPLGLKYILYVNTLSEYKNILIVLKAFNFIKLNIEHKLVFVGKSTPYWENVLLPYIKKEKLEDRVIQLSDLDDSELKYLYTHASLFVTASLHEGFGYTPIEAGICKCPVISSRCEALPDSTMDLLFYYEPPCDYKVLGEKIISVLTSPPDQPELEFISQKYKNRYDPRNQVEQIYNLFSELKTS